MTTAPTAREDLEHVESTLNKLFKIAIESLRHVEEGLRKGVEVDLTPQVDLADHLKETIYTEALFYIAKWQPLGHELLYVEALIKASYDLFRITRYANEIAMTINMARRVVDGELADLTARARTMVEKAFRALLGRDYAEARGVEELDAAIDKAYRSELSRIARSEKVDCSDALKLLVLRQLERIADHATYIAREVLRVVRATS